MKESTARRSLSVSMGDYLKAVWELAGDGAASTKAIAGKLGVRPASVTNMFVRLHEMGLVGYERYRGVALTEEGRAEALRLIRCHRLIKTFLLEYLGYPWQEVHEAARKLEHGVFDEGFAEKLAEHLGHPERDPYGDLIPRTDGALPLERSYPLSEAAVGCRVRISKVSDEDASILEHLWQRGLVPGRLLGVTEMRTLDGVITVEDDNGAFHALGESLASSIFVQSFLESRD